MVLTAPTKGAGGAHRGCNGTEVPTYIHVRRTCLMGDYSVPYGCGQKNDTRCAFLWIIP